MRSRERWAWAADTCRRVKQSSWAPISTRITTSTSMVRCWSLLISASIWAATWEGNSCRRDQPVPDTGWMPPSDAPPLPTKEKVMAV